MDEGCSDAPRLFFAQSQGVFASERTAASQLQNVEAVDLRVKAARIVQFHLRQNDLGPPDDEISNTIDALLRTTPAGYSTGQQAGRPVMSALRINPDSAYVFVDGALNEPVWQRVTAADGFRQREPNEGAPATEATERW